MFVVPRRKGTIVMGSSVQPFFRPSVRPTVSPSVRRHNLVSATPPTVFKGFWWHFPVIVLITWRCAYFIEVVLDWFLPELWPFNNFSAVSLVSETPPTVFKVFWWNFPVIVPITWRCAYYTEVTLDRFLPEWWPFVSFSHFKNRSSCLRNSSYSFQWSFMKLSRYCCHDLTWRCAYFIEVMLDWFLPELLTFNNFLAVSRVSATTRSFQRILVKPSYCSHDLKRIILYRGNAWPLFTRVMALWQF